MVSPDDDNNDKIKEGDQTEEELIQLQAWYDKVQATRTPGEIYAVLSDIYSPKRVTALLPHEGILPGFAMNLTTTDDEGKPWDFDRPEQRAKARRKVEEEKPTILIGSPMCTAFCHLQAINFSRMDPERVRTILTRARMHLAFSCELYRMQLAGGRHFIHEHPAAATSWSEPCICRLLRTPGVQVATVDACQYGME